MQKFCEISNLHGAAASCSRLSIAPLLIVPWAAMKMLCCTSSMYQVTRCRRLRSVQTHKTHSELQLIDPAREAPHVPGQRNQTPRAQPPSAAPQEPQGGQSIPINDGTVLDLFRQMAESMPAVSWMRASPASCWRARLCMSFASKACMHAPYSDEVPCLQEPVSSSHSSCGRTMASQILLDRWDTAVRGQTL